MKASKFEGELREGQVVRDLFEMALEIICEKEKKQPSEPGELSAMFFLLGVFLTTTASDSRNVVKTLEEMAKQANDGLESMGLVIEVKKTNSLNEFEEFKRQAKKKGDRVAEPRRESEQKKEFIGVAADSSKLVH